MTDYNFFESYIRKYGILSTKNGRICIISLLGMMLLVAVPIINQLQIEKYEEKVLDANHKLMSSEAYQQRLLIEERMKENEKLQIYLTSLAKFDKAVKNVDMINDHLVYTITNTIPNELYFQSLRIGDQQVIIEGVAKNKRAIAILESNLRKIPAFEDIVISNIKILDEGDCSFTIHFKKGDGRLDEIN